MSDATRALIVCLWCAACAHTPEVRSGPPSSRNVTFTSGDGTVTLAGTLIVPTDATHGVVLLSVAGPNERDQRVGDNAGFAELANSLAARGVASLRFDDRGIGGSTGDYFAASWLDLAGDAIEALNVLERETLLPPDRLGYAGMSQGAALAALATMQRSAGFVILLSAPGLTGVEALRLQLETALATVPEERAVFYRELFRRYVEILGDPELAQDARRAQLIEFLGGPGRGLIPPYRFIPRDREALADLLLGPWYRSNVEFAPAEVYSAIKAPVLVVAGARDVVTPPAHHLSGLLRHLSDRPARDLTVLVLNDGNHLLQNAKTGLPDEYGALPDGMSSRAKDAIASWIIGVSCDEQVRKE